MKYYSTGDDISLCLKLDVTVWDYFRDPSGYGLVQWEQTLHIKASSGINSFQLSISLLPHKIHNHNFCKHDMMINSQTHQIPAYTLKKYYILRTSLCKQINCDI